MSTEVEKTELPSVVCPDCGQQTIVVLMEFSRHEHGIDCDYQVYCSQEDECGFTDKLQSIDQVYDSKHKSAEECRQVAEERAYRGAVDRMSRL